VAVVPGDPTSQSSFRSEVAGIFAIATMVKAVCDEFGLTSGSVEVGCDGKEALYRCFSPDFHPKHSIADFDLLTSTRSVLHSCPISWRHRHVKGHQDEDPSAELDRWATLNIEMDLSAKAHWLSTASLAHPYFAELPGEPWAVWSHGIKISSRLHSQLVTSIHGRDASDWWSEKQRFGPDPSSVSLVDWDACGRAMKAAPTTRRHWVSKHVSGFCSVGKMMARWNQWPTSDCP
jgi:hypothetical protein